MKKLVLLLMIWSHASCLAEFGMWDDRFVEEYESYRLLLFQLQFLREHDPNNQNFDI